MRRHKKKKSAEVATAAGGKKTDWLVGDLVVAKLRGHRPWPPQAHCHSPVDEYVEYETLIVIIDTILHKPEAYRHLFFNYPELHHFNLLNLLWKATLVDLLLDTFERNLAEVASAKNFKDGWKGICLIDGNLPLGRRALQGVGKQEAIKWDSLTSFISTAGKVTAQTACLNCAFLVVLSLVARVWPRRGSNATMTSRHILLAVLLSSHFKLVVFAMLVWEFSPLMNLMIDMLVFSSNTVALKVMLKTTTAHAAVAAMSGAGAKIVVGTLLGIFGLDLFHRGNFYNR